MVFAQGCPHRCKGCHNPQTHDFDGGYDTTVENIINEVKKNPYLKGVTLSGGEPFCQAKPLAVLAKKAHELGLDVITYTGYTYEELIEGANEENGYIELLKETDILVDGRFILEEKTLELRFRGSRNQRVIDPKASLKEGRVVETDF